MTESRGRHVFFWRGWQGKAPGAWASERRSEGMSAKPRNPERLGSLGLFYVSDS